MRILLLLFFGLALPVYIFRTRGVRGFKTIGWTLLLAAGMVAIVFATGLLTFWIGDIVGLWESGF